MNASDSNTNGQEELISAIAAAARDWRDPNYEPRAEGVERTLKAPNRFTEEALAFAINQQMAELTKEKLFSWIGTRWAERPTTVGVVCPESVPLAGLRDSLGVLLTGHALQLAVPSDSPHLLPAFLEEISRYADINAQRMELEKLFAASNAVIAKELDDSDTPLEEACEAHGIPSERRLIRKEQISVAVLDGHEPEDEQEGLAEDMLLYEGLGSQSVAIVWAPDDLEPDSYLHAMAAFRAVFPAHEDTPGALTLQQAMLEAVDHPHAYGEGLEFLVSRGEPEPQGPGHVRWAPYETLSDVRAWLQSERADIQIVVAREGLHSELPEGIPLILPGEAHRAPLGSRSADAETVAFLSKL